MCTFTEKLNSHALVHGCQGNGPRSKTSFHRGDTAWVGGRMRGSTAQQWALRRWYGCLKWRKKSTKGRWVHKIENTSSDLVDKRLKSYVRTGVISKKKWRSPDIAQPGLKCCHPHKPPIRMGHGDLDLLSMDFEIFPPLPVTCQNEQKSARGSKFIVAEGNCSGDLQAIERKWEKEKNSVTKNRISSLKVVSFSYLVIQSTSPACCGFQFMLSVGLFSFLTLPHKNNFRVSPKWE